MHEGRVQRLVERHRADDGHAQGRHGGDDREKRDDADMQASRRRLGPPGADQQRRLENHQPEQDQRGQKIDQKQQRDGFVGRIDRRQIGEDQKAANRRNDCEGNDKRPETRQKPPLAAPRSFPVESFFSGLTHSTRRTGEDFSTDGARGRFESPFQFLLGRLGYNAPACVAILPLCCWITTFWRLFWHAWQNCLAQETA